MFLGRIVLLLALSSVGTATSQEKTDAMSLDGPWKVTKMVKRGELMGPDEIAGISLTFAKGKATLHSRDDKRTFGFKIDGTKKPKEIDLTAADGTFKGQTIPGIYQLDGDSLVLCLPHDRNKDRPDAFESLGGVAPSRILLNLKRVKD